ncbi:MAG: hypothetical protein AABY18_05660 [Candidatus Thermoplasmatota archaeon]
MSEKTRHGARDASHPHPGARMPKVPDKTTLGLATLFAAFVAFGVLLLFVLPAEYGIDPTKFGQMTGISKLAGDGGEIDLGGRLGTVSRVEPAAPRNDTMTIELPAGEDNEFKLHLLVNQSLLYTWTATGPVNFDFHGDPDRPTRPGEFSSYDEAQGTGRSGSFQAPFDGRHGWYFQNVGDVPVTITLQTWGYYDVIGLLG